MAESNEILIQVDIDTVKVQNELSQAITRVKELSQRQRELRTEIEAGNDSNGEYAKQLAETSAELEKNKRQVQAQTSILQAAGAQTVKTTDSLNSQRQALNTLQKAYANLSGDAKAAADAQGGLRDKIKELTESVKAQEHAIGDDRRNVGNYADSIREAFNQLGPMKGLLEGVAGGTTTMSKAVDSADKIFKGFSVNPLFATIMVLSSVLSLIAGALRKNEQAMQGVNKLTAGIGASLSSIKPLLDWLTKYLVDSLLKALDWVTDAIKSMLGWIDKVAKKFGKDLHLSDAFDAGAAAADQMTNSVEQTADAVDDLAERARKAKYAIWLAEQEAIEMQRNNIEALQKESERAEKAADKAIQAIIKAQEQQLAMMQVDEEETGEDTESFDDMARKMFGLDADGVAYFKQLLNDGYTYAEAKSIALKDQQTRTVQAIGAAMGELGSSFSDLSGVLDEFGEKNAAARKASKAFALASIIASEAQSISQGAVAVASGIAQAQSQPFPLNIAAMVSTVAAIGGMLASTISSIRQAKSVMSSADSYAGAHASGGFIKGSGRYDGKDDMVARVSKGEAILNPRQQANFMDLANGRGVASYEGMYTAMRAALQDMPAPVLTYQEFNEFNQRTAHIQEIASI